jgi:hypothetical protein
VDATERTAAVQGLAQSASEAVPGGVVSKDSPGVASFPSIPASPPPFPSTDTNGASPPTITVHVLQGSSVSHPIAFLVHEWPSVCIGDLKARVCSATGIRPERQRLLFKGCMEGEETKLCEWKGLKDGSKISLMTRK